jgi:hypothetical protein
VNSRFNRVAAPEATDPCETSNARAQGGKCTGRYEDQLLLVFDHGFYWLEQGRIEAVRKAEIVQDRIIGGLGLFVLVNVVSEPRDLLASHWARNLSFMICAIVPDSGRAAAPSF